MSPAQQSALAVVSLSVFQCLCQEVAALRSQYQDIANGQDTLQARFDWVEPKIDGLMLDSDKPSGEGQKGGEQQ